MAAWLGGAASLNPPLLIKKGQENALGSSSSFTIAEHSLVSAHDDQRGRFLHHTTTTTGTSAKKTTEVASTGDGQSVARR